MPPAAPTPALALLVHADAASRRDAAAALERAGYEAVLAQEPYEGMARFMERSPALVLFSLLRCRTRDLHFVEAVRRRAPATHIVLLVPEGQRALAAKALEAGADSFLAEPWYAAELIAIARRLLARGAAPRSNATGQERVRALAREVSHAINNPLQVLSLLSETGALGGDADPVRREVARIDHVVAWLNAYADLGDPAPQPLLLGPLLAERLAAAAQTGQVSVGPRVVAPGPEVTADPTPLTVAFDALIGYLHGLGSGEAVPVDGRVRTVRLRDGAGVEAALRGRGLDVAPDRLEQDRARVLWSHDTTRAAHPGLALPQAVARAHGGQLVARAADRGPVLALRLPLGGEANPELVRKS